MAMYNAEEDKIIGCRKYSWQWWYERGHQIAHHNEKWHEVTVLWTQFILLGILVLLSFEENLWARYLVLVICGIIFVDEIFAWYYCLKNYKKWR